MYYIFLSFFIVKLAYSHEDFDPQPIVLNINKNEPKNIVVLRQNFYNIDTLVYTPKDGYINEVIDDRGIIWKNDRGRLKLSKVIKFRKESKLLHVHYISADNLSFVKYFYRTGRVWNEINSEQFYLEFDLHRSKSSAVTYYTIYLKRRNDEKRTRVNRSSNPKFAAYSPNYGYLINKVCDVNLWILCFKSVWTSKEDERCLFTSVHNRDKPDLAYLVISDSGNVVEKFYHKPPGAFKSWKLIDKTEYYNKLKERDIDPDKFDNTVQLDLNNIDAEKFYSSEFGYKRSTIAAYPKPGFRMTRVSYGNMIIWESGESNVYSYCANMFSDNEEPRLCYVLVSEGSERRIEYFLNNNNTWDKIDKKRFYHLLANKDDPRYTHRNVGVDEEGNRNIEMSYFTNKQGLMVKTYRSMVPNHKGVILLIHGFGMHFLSTFMKYNLDWNYRNFGFATHPYIICPDVNFFYDYSRFNYDRFKHIFEYNFYDKVYPSNLIQMFEYSSSMLECLNNMGYSVYGMDLQSNGFSESIDSIKSHFNRYTDYITDVKQFAYIIRNQKFNDTSQVWNERVNSRGIKFKEKFIILGYSMGSNVSFRAIGEFNRHHESNERLADAFISLSGMFDLASNIKDLYHKAYIAFFPLFAAFAPRYKNRYQQYPNYGQRYNFTLFLNDERYGPHFCSWRTLKSLYVACWESKINAKDYPNNMPTLFIHSSEDYKCNIKGVRKLEAKLGFNASVVEMPGRDHHTFETDFMEPISKNLTEWLAKVLRRYDHNTPN